MCRYGGVDKALELLEESTKTKPTVLFTDRPAYGCKHTRDSTDCCLPGSRALERLGQCLPGQGLCGLLSPKGAPEPKPIAARRGKAKRRSNALKQRSGSNRTQTSFSTWGGCTSPSVNWTKRCECGGLADSQSDWTWRNALGDLRAFPFLSCSHRCRCSSSL